jgi:ferredoxin
MSKFILSAIVLLAALMQCSAFFQSLPTVRALRAKSSLSMLIIKADGKTIETKEKSVNLRKELMANKVDVYPLKAKITGNCGGAGICGTCAVKVLEGANNMNPPSKNEQNTLRGKPADFRLSCCARVTGNISVKTKP